ncbi:hypothetical protein YPPY07_4779, partial [Yersinia pestis PY-07]
MLPSLLAKKT